MVILDMRNQEEIEKKKLFAKETEDWAKVEAYVYIILFTEMFWLWLHVFSKNV